jgi:RecA-family ATPase
MFPKGHHALALARLGFRVFPLRPDDPELPPEEIKRPAIKDWQRLATTDEQQIAEWWSRANYNIATPTLPDGELVVLDYDVAAGKRGADTLRYHETFFDLPDSYRVRTASGGVHVYLKAPAGTLISNSASRIGPNADVRGNARGGYVVAPGSTIHGRPYAATHTGPIEPMPSCLIELARTVRNKVADTRTPLVDLDAPETIHRASKWLSDEAPEAVEGCGGDETTFRVACRLKDFGIGKETALDLMLDHWNEHKAIPPWPLDQLEAKVENAYRYGQLPPGSANALAEFDAVEIEQGNPASEKPKSRIYSRKRNALAERPERRPHLIRGLIDQQSVVITYGESNAGKSFIALDRALHIATGKPYLGRPVNQAAVAYIATEGGYGIQFRIEAWCKKHGVDAATLQFTLVPCPVNFLGKGDIGDLVGVLKRDEEELGQRLGLIVVDTLNRTLAGGDENSSVDMGRFVRVIDHLRETFKSTIDVIHHTGKDKLKGARGHSLLRAAADSEFEVDKNGTISNTKQRDMEHAADTYFRLEKVELGTDVEGEILSSAVAMEKSKAEIEFDVTLTPQEEELWGIILEYTSEQDEVNEKGEQNQPIKFTAADLRRYVNESGTSSQKEVWSTKLIATVTSRTSQKRPLRKTAYGQWVRDSSQSSQSSQTTSAPSSLSSQPSKRL